jgi:TolB protein
MTASSELDRRLADYLADRSTLRAPVGLLESAMDRIDTAGQRRWLRFVPASSTSPAWLPAVRRVAFVGAVSLLVLLGFLLALVVGSRRPVPTPLGLARPGLIAFEAGNRIYVANADGTGRHPITFGPALDSFPAWSNDGTRIAYISQGGAPAPLEVRVADPLGRNQVVVASGLSYATTPDKGCCEPPFLDWSRDDRQLVLAAAVDNTKVPRIVVVSVDPPSQHALGASDLSGLNPVWSPEGREIAIKRFAPDESIWVAGSDGSALRRVTTVQGDGGSFYRPQWSPDGRRLAFEAGHQGALRIYVVNRDGTDEHAVENPISNAYLPVWSPDGSALAWMGSADGGDVATAIVIADSNGSRPRVINVGPLQSAPLIWSPDARHILAYSPASDHTPKLFIIEVTGRSQPVAISAEETYSNASWQRLPP